jgi:hypothetical protein
MRNSLGNLRRKKERIFLFSRIGGSLWKVEGLS